MRTNIITLLKLLNKIESKRKYKGEDALTNSVAIELKALSLEGHLKGIWLHVPNETVTRTKTELLEIKKKCSLGMIPGAPDFVFLAPNKSLCIELKTSTGKLSSNQKLFASWSKNCGVNYFVARSVEEVKHILEKEGLYERTFY